MAPILSFKCTPDKRLHVITNEVVFDAWYFISLIIHQSFATRETNYGVGVSRNGLFQHAVLAAE